MRFDMAQRVQVCKDFVRDATCQYSEKCKFAHPDTCVEQTPGEVLLCGDAFRSATKQCPRGDNCKYYHAFEGQQLPRTTPRLLGVCREFFHSLVGCKRGTQCHFAHPQPNVAMPRYVEVCLNFVIGKCERENCKYYHDVDSRVDHGLCRDFPVCPRGSNCQFTHPSTKRARYFVEQPLPAEKITDASRNCLDFFHRGSCSRGSECKFSHSEHSPTQSATVGAPKGDVAEVSRDSKKRRVETYTYGYERELTGPIADPSRECLDFFHGKCSRGAECKFKHVPVGSTLADPRSDCLQFFYGKCTRGEDCKFAHTNVRGSEKDLRGQYATTVEPPAPKYFPKAPEVLPHRRQTYENTKKQDPCKEFMLGKCSRDTCKFLHDVNAVCPEFQRGYCSRGSDCLFAHKEECHDYMHGRCTRGDACRFTHNPESIIIK
eukprot:GEMP01017330.1.p1 GENE.GEMP01017330.1~~GEMP01017330.1.p1  ORF type:complete len:431 (+),score=84.14 GEMP01017330.1:99-1391(+)